MPSYAAVQPHRYKRQGGGGVVANPCDFTNMMFPAVAGWQREQMMEKTRQRCQEWIKANPEAYKQWNEQKIKISKKKWGGGCHSKRKKCGGGAIYSTRPVRPVYYLK